MSRVVQGQAGQDLSFFLDGVRRIRKSAQEGFPIRYDVVKVVKQLHIEEKDIFGFYRWFGWMVRIHKKEKKKIILVTSICSPS